MYLANVRASVARSLLRVKSPREVHSNAESIETCLEIVNRNPRNLERLRIARMPEGYHLEEPGRKYWHKLFLIKKPRYISAEVHHFENGPVITASSNEWALKKHLYRGTDSSAYTNVGRVLAQRCLEAGICEMKVEYGLTGEKCKLLIKQLKRNKIRLSEPLVYKYPNSWDRYRPPKPWEIHE